MSRCDVKTREWELRMLVKRIILVVNHGVETNRRPVILQKEDSKKLKSLVKLRVRASNIQKDELWYTQM